MKFERKSLAEIAKMTDEEKEKYFAEKESYEREERQKELDQVKNEITKSINEQKDETGKSLDEVKAIIEEIKRNQMGGVTEEALIKALKEKHSEIKKVYEAGSGVVEIEFKAVGSVATTNGTNANVPTLQGTQDAALGNIGLRKIDILGLFSRLSTNQASYAYTEAVPKDGDYGFVEEGKLKPQVDFKWDTRYATPLKVAAHMVLTEEAVTDVAGLESVAKNYLRGKHDLKKAKGLLNGTGTNGEPKGITAYGKPFVAGSLALAIEKPNFMDVVNSAIVSVRNRRDYEDQMQFQPNLVLINEFDFVTHILSAKTKEGTPLYPNASIMNAVKIGDAVIMPSIDIPAGKIFVGDLKRYFITDYVGFSIRIGWINDNFITNQFVMVGESRFHAFVKKLDENAFLYDDINTIKTAITKP